MTSLVPLRHTPQAVVATLKADAIDAEMFKQWRLGFVTGSPTISECARMLKDAIDARIVADYLAGGMYES